MPVTILASQAVTFPASVEASRPASPTAGMTRYNTSTNKLEYYNGTLWQGLETSAVDPYWSSVSLYLRGGSLTDLKGRHSVSAVNVSTSSSPGKPFSLAESTSWYYLNNDTNRYLEISNTLDDFDPSQNTNLTIEFWLYRTGENSSYGHFYNIGGQGGQGVIKFGPHTGSSYNLYWYSSNGELINYLPSGGFSSGQWNHFVFEKAGSTNTTWVNGTRTAQNTNTLPGGNPSFLRLGLNFGGETATHYFDELRITTVARYNGAASIPIQTKSYPTVG